MDPISITLACGTALKTVYSITKYVTETIKDYKSARVELLALRGDINNLEAVIDLVQHDCEPNNSEKSKDYGDQATVGDSALPAALTAHLTNILKNCDDVLKDLKTVLAKHFSSRLGPSAKWVDEGKKEVAKLRATLAAHTGALNLALNLVELYVPLSRRSAIVPF
jgi:hypothetical protein